MARQTNPKLLADFFNKIGPSRQFAPTQQFGRFRCEVDMRRKPIAGGLTARFLKQISIGSRFNGKLDEYRGDGLYC
jgi:hypothetical protein